MNVTIVILLFATISLFSMILSAAAVLFILHRMKRKARMKQLQIDDSGAALPAPDTGEDTASLTSNKKVNL